MQKTAFPERETQNERLSHKEHDRSCANNVGRHADRHMDVEEVTTRDLECFQNISTQSETQRKFKHPNTNRIFCFINKGLHFETRCLLFVASTSMQQKLRLHPLMVLRVVLTPLVLISVSRVF